MSDFGAGIPGFGASFCLLGHFPAFWAAATSPGSTRGSVSWIFLGSRGFPGEPKFTRHGRCQPQPWPHKGRFYPKSRLFLGIFVKIAMDPGGDQHTEHSKEVFSKRVLGTELIWDAEGKQPLSPPNRLWEVTPGSAQACLQWSKVHPLPAYL